jgi:acyl carrier protein
MQGRLTQVEGRRESTDFEALVQRAISKICDLDPARVQPDVKLGDLGVDSLAAAEVLVELEITLGRDFPVDVLRRLDHVDTVRGIAAELEAAFGHDVSGPLQ